MSVAIRSAIVGIAVCGLLGFASSARAADRSGYLSLSGGASFPSGDVSESDVTNSVNNAALPDDELSLDTGYMASPAIGVYAGNFRFEFQYTVQTNDINGIEGLGLDDSFDGTLHSNLFMLNAYYDIPIADRLSAYVGAGAGAVYVTFDGEGTNGVVIDNQNGTAFAYQVMAGLEYQLTPVLSVFGGYRGWGATSLETQHSEMDLPWSNLAEIGLRISL